ncbi:hypothetical protein D3C87_1705390 [compost metagenome]
MSATTRSRTCARAASKNIAKDITKDILECIGIRSALSATETTKASRATTTEGSASSAKALSSRMTELIIHLTLLRVRKGFVSFRDLFKFFFCFFVARIFIRMELHRKLAVRFFDLIRRSRACNI